MYHAMGQPLRSAPPSMMGLQPRGTGGTGGGGASRAPDFFSFSEEADLAPGQGAYMAAPPGGAAFFVDAPHKPAWSQGGGEGPGDASFFEQRQPFGHAPQGPPMGVGRVAPVMGNPNTEQHMFASRSAGLVGPPGGFFGDHVWASTELEGVHDSSPQRLAGGDGDFQARMMQMPFRRSSDFSAAAHNMSSASSDAVPEDVRAGWLAGVEDVLADTPNSSARPSVDHLGSQFAASHL